MSQQLSDRITNMSTSATLAMAAKARELRAEGKDIIGLTHAGTRGRLRCRRRQNAE